MADEYFIYRNSDTEPIPYVTHLMFDDTFNREIDIPDTITHLIFGWRYNQPTTLPPTITHLTFGGLYNQPVILPNTITHLTFGTFYNQPTHLPSSITNLIFGEKYNQPTHLPPYLERFILENTDNYKQYKEQLLNSPYLIHTNIRDKDIKQQAAINSHNLNKISIVLTKLCLSLIN